jgi:hypothetical protein
MRAIYAFIILFLSGCSSIVPNLTPTTNSYTYIKPKVNDRNIISSTLVYTYSTTTLENQYKKSFCAGLNDCSLNINNVKANPQFGNFDMDKQPIINNQFNIKNISLYRIIYQTRGQNNEICDVSGAVFMPDIPNPRGLILFFHPTFFSKTSVPSYAPDKATDIALAAVFAANGYIVVAPDYIGMGYDKDIVHPYVLYPQINAEDGLSMLNASTTFLSNLGYTTNNMQLFVSGYSEGGAYALWFSRLYQEQADFKQQLDGTKFQLKMVAPISGAYNLSNVTYSYLFSDVGLFTKSNFNVPSTIMASTLKPALLANTLISYAYYNESANYYKVFNPDFFNMQCSLQYSHECKFNEQQLNLYEALSYESDDVLIVNKISNAASHKTYNGQMFSTQWNGVMPLINQNILYDKSFIRTLTAGDVYYWHSEIPTTLIYLEHDSVVSSYNSTIAYQGMLNMDSKNLSSIGINNSLIKENMVDVLPGFDVDHITGFNYLFLVALNQFNQVPLAP